MHTYSYDCNRRYLVAEYSERKGDAMFPVAEDMLITQPLLRACMCFNTALVIPTVAFTYEYVI